MAGIHDKFGLSRVINAAGTFTPLGVSRSSPAIRAMTAEALGEFFVIDELQNAASAAIARWSGAEAGAVTHCVAAGITVSVAAAMTGAEPARIAALPDTEGLPDRVVIPAAHVVDYGHSILQAVRLAGAVPVLAGTDRRCTAEDLETHLGAPGTACLLLVSSRLVKPVPVDLTAAVAAAHRASRPAIIDGAAQDIRIGDLLATNADLVLVSAHKYMASPTAGLVAGRRELVNAVRAQEKGIGRTMKPSKEAILGLLAAIEERETVDLAAWSRDQDAKLARFLARVEGLAGVSAAGVADPAGMPFARAELTIDPARAGQDATNLADTLAAGDPAIWVMRHELAAGRIILELVPLDDGEIETIAGRIAAELAT